VKEEGEGRKGCGTDAKLPEEARHVLWNLGHIAASPVTMINIRVRLFLNRPSGPAKANILRVRLPIGRTTLAINILEEG